MNVTYVIHYGLTYDLADYCQQVGRAGRGMDSDSHAFAILYVYPESNVKSKESIAKYVKNSSNFCLRKMLYSPFNVCNTEIKSIEPGHLCCCYCNTLCDCSADCKNFYVFENGSLQPMPSRSVQNPVRVVTEAGCNLVRDLLNEFHEMCVEDNVLMTPGSLVTGITSSVIESVIS